MSNFELTMFLIIHGLVLIAGWTFAAGLALWLIGAVAYWVVSKARDIKFLIYMIALAQQPDDHKAALFWAAVREHAEQSEAKKQSLLAFVRAVVPAPSELGEAVKVALEKALSASRRIR